MNDLKKHSPEPLKIIALGQMSGTSLDGIDLALCEFTYYMGVWEFEIIDTLCVSYSDEWVKKLETAHEIDAYSFIDLHRKYGQYLGEEIVNFVSNRNINVIGAHGHTIFHEPDKNLSFQLGCGAQIAAKTKTTVVNDFRTLDIALGGQGAPLVPIGDSLLFSKYQACINLGGFANISFKLKEEIIAFDICPVNIVLNYICQNYFSCSFDKNGHIGMQGNSIPELLDKLNGLPFYELNPPKSLAREWLYSSFLPIIEPYLAKSPTDVLNTCYLHFAKQISAIIISNKLSNVLISGGGAYNNFLINLIKKQCPNAIICIESKDITDYKEAIVFAFLAVLRLQNQNNCISSVTGAISDNSGGSIWQG